MSRIETHIHTMQDVLSLLESRASLPPQPALLQAVLQSLGNPQAKLRCIHIAGTNGKGSTAVMLANILTCAGHRTGLFTSPHIRHFTERICLDGQEINPQALFVCCAAVLRAEAETGVTLNYFSMATVMALVYFSEMGCEFAVLEAGLGGRLDPTNCLTSPEVCILTRIGLDHMAALGDTLIAIAEEKAGIIKPGCTVVSAGQQAEVMRVIHEVANRQAATVYEAPQLAFRTEAGSLLLHSPLGLLKLGLSGLYQAENAAIVLAAAHILRAKGVQMQDAAIRDGLRTARWPARFEQLTGVLLDGAHNPDGAAAFARSIEAAHPGKRCVFVMAFMRDKDATGCIRALAPLALGMVAAAVSHPRAMPVDTLCGCMGNVCANVRAAGSVAEGLTLARSMAGGHALVAACGSLYMADAVRAWSEKQRIIPL